MIAPGSVLGGKYLVERTLGEGGMGVVVAAKHLQLGHRVAIKMMLADGARNADALARFEREARAAAELASDHVARVTDVGHFEDGMPYMVMEYLEGEDLAVRIEREGALPIGDVMRMFIHACIGLGDAHAQGIVHRDIKPSNLFLSARRGGRVTLKVLDFGIAKANLTVSDHHLTRTSGMMGSPQYMSPEQLRDTKHVDARTDIWSLGASMYEALTGAPAFPAETLPELHVKILTEEPSSALGHRADAPRELDAILARCLTKDPRGRYASMHELQTELEDLELVLAAPLVAFRSDPNLVAFRSDSRLVAFRSNRSLGGTALSETQDDSALGTPSGVRTLPPEGARRSGSHGPFPRNLEATDNPISTTRGGGTSRAAQAFTSWGFLAGAAATLVAGALLVTKLLHGSPSAQPAEPAAAGAPTPVVVEVAPLVPSLPVEPLLPALPSVAPARMAHETPKAAKAHGAKSLAGVDAPPSRGAAAVAPVAKKKRPSSLDPELE